MGNILKDKDIVSKVLNILNESCTIPDNGFLAGGAVANTLLSMKYGDTYPINDLDIFIESEEKDDPFDMEYRSSMAPTRTQELTILSGYYEGELSYDHGSNYRILEVERDGLLNWITISRVSDRSNLRNYSYILNGFDFNCCQVGIDLKTNELYYTEEFERFLNTKQLDVTAIYTPAHTAIRLFKKKKELNCYCDVEKCMELLSQPLIRETRVRLHSRYFGTYFSHKYKSMFLEHYGDIKPFFSMVSFFDDKKEMWDVSNNNNNTRVSLDRYHVTNWLDPQKTIPIELLQKWETYNDIMWTLVPIKYNTPNVRIKEILSSVEYNPLTFMSSYKLINGKIKNNIINKCEIVLREGKYTKLLTLLNPYFCDCDFSSTHINDVEGFVSKYSQLLNIIVKFKINLQECVELIKAIKRVISVEGDWIEIKLMEILGNWNVVIKPTYENICNSLKTYKIEMSKPLVDEIKFLSQIKLPKDVLIKELVSELEIHWAGNKLKNCLNNPGQNYIERIKSGEVKVIIISTPNSISALELHVKTDDIKYEEKQLLSICNKQSSHYHRIIADIVKAELNSNLLKTQYNKRLDLYRDVSLLNRGLLVSAEDKKVDGDVGEVLLREVVLQNPEVVIEVNDEDMF
tara:strand:+ start:3443 stop:5332 length:1890 start_codon:yes stop_codon:yes gene_type:complete